MCWPHCAGGTTAAAAEDAGASGGATRSGGGTSAGACPRLRDWISRSRPTGTAAVAATHVYLFDVKSTSANDHIHLIVEQGILIH